MVDCVFPKVPGGAPRGVLAPSGSSRPDRARAFELEAPLRSCSPSVDALWSQRRRRAEHRELACARRLDPLGDLDLALAGQQAHLPHLAEVDAHRIGAARLAVGGAACAGSCCACAAPASPSVAAAFFILAAPDGAALPFVLPLALPLGFVADLPPTASASSRDGRDLRLGRSRAGRPRRRLGGGLLALPHGGSVAGATSGRVVEDVGAFEAIGGVSLIRPGNSFRSRRLRDASCVEVSSVPVLLL